MLIEPHAVKAYGLWKSSSAHFESRHQMGMSDPFREPAVVSSRKEPLELNSLEDGWAPDQLGHCLEGIKTSPVLGAGSLRLYVETINLCNI